MSQYKNNAPADHGRTDVEPLPNNFFPKWVGSMGSVVTERGAGRLGANLQSVMPQALPDAPVPNTPVPTDPTEKRESIVLSG